MAKADRDIAANLVVVPFRNPGAACSAAQRLRNAARAGVSVAGTIRLCRVGAGASERLTVRPARSQAMLAENVAGQAIGAYAGGRR